MDNPILWQALLGLFAIAAIAFCVLGAQVWRIPTVLTVVGLFLGAATFFILAALTLRTHAYWRSTYLQQQKEIAAAEEEHLKLMRGDPSGAADGVSAGTVDDAPAGEEGGEVDGEAAPTEAPVADMAGAIESEADLLQMGNRRLRKELGAIREDRGKTWHGNGTLALPNATVTITSPGTTQLVENMPVYVFEKKNDGIFLGEFKVTAVAADSVTLALTETLSPEQLQALAGKNGEWIVRSIMPVDSHEAFRGMPKEELTKLIPQAATGLDAAGYEALINEYVRDGQPAKPSDPADRVFKRVRMKKEVDLEFTDAKGEKTTQKMQSDDVLLVSSEKAQELVTKHEAEIVDPTGIYVRPLRNYENTRRTLSVRMFELADRGAQVCAQTASVEASIKAANEVRMASLTKEETGLKADLEKMNRDRDVIKKYLEDLNAQQTQLLADFKKQYGENNRLAAELTKLQVDLAKKIDAQASVNGGANVVPVSK